MKFQKSEIPIGHHPIKDLHKFNGFALLQITQKNGDKYYFTPKDHSLADPSAVYFRVVEEENPIEEYEDLITMNYRELKDLLKGSYDACVNGLHFETYMQAVKLKAISENS